MRTYYLELIVHTNYLVIIDRDFQYQHHLNLAERLFLSCKMLKKTGIKKPYSKKSVIENCVFCDIAQRSKNYHANTHYYLLQFFKTHCAKYLNRNRRSGNCSTQCKSKFLNIVRILVFTQCNNLLLQCDFFRPACLKNHALLLYKIKNRKKHFD